VHSYLRWQTPADTLGIVGYQAEGTIGWEIKHGSRNIKAVTPWKEEIAINLDLSIEVFQFSGHASSQGLLELIKANKPARIFPVHGAKIAQSDFREYLGKANLHLESLDLRSPVILAT
ncbi:MAG TPA: MBL fold metallo-hydrolase RNA specificity domain-containing protein, partial [Candidatus Hodarchaeales archaeon]|nr:MBL fold metallo-hydrolase RNA specificity domain-containing protein [Candidatus Hodarchaeales archaeon]